MYVRENCIYCARPLTGRYCETCEPKHFVRASDPSDKLLPSSTDKGKARKPGEWK